jgi:hypothetical protein
MSLPDLAAVLWRQRELLERLTYRLECEQLILATGKSRWLAMAISEVELLSSELSVIEMQRAVVADAVALDLGLLPGASLEDLAAAANPPWTAMLLEHRDTLLAVTAELSALAENTRTLTAAGLAAVESTLQQAGMREGATSRGYNARGRSDVIAGHGRSVVDRAL